MRVVVKQGGGHSKKTTYGTWNDFLAETVSHLSIVGATIFVLIGRERNDENKVKSMTGNECSYRLVCH